MTISLQQAEKIVKDNLEGANIKGSTEEGEFYLFLAPWGDPLEGNLLPFFKVNKTTGAFRDFDPQSYPNPLGIINRLTGRSSDG